MCTVSVISMQRAGYRIVCNRDEQWDRADAANPRWREIAGGSRAIWPADGQAGGTWIAASATGVTLCLLNMNPVRKPKLPPPEQLVSRGKIIPAIISSTDAQAACAKLRELDLDCFAPFRVVAVDLVPASSAGDERPTRVFEASWNRRVLRIDTAQQTPACFVSSGLGDHHASPRLGLFDEMVGGEAGESGAENSAPEAQDAFHSHVWLDRRHISVMMTRPEARTVSVTTVEVSPRAEELAIKMRYRPVLAVEARTERAAAGKRG